MSQIFQGSRTVLEQQSVLIVEDHMLIAISVEQVALDLGAAFTRVLRADAALRAAEKCEAMPDICVIDYRSANGKARRIAELARAQGSALIVMTTDAQDRTDDLAKKADAVLRKPFGDQDICTAFQFAVKAKKSRA